MPGFLWIIPTAMIFGSGLPEAVRELVMGMPELSSRLELSLTGISQSVKRGEMIAEEEGFYLIDI